VRFVLIFWPWLLKESDIDLEAGPEKKIREVRMGRRRIWLIMRLCIFNIDEFEEYTRIFGQK
jgi:hypothetical protein